MGENFFSIKDNYFCVDILFLERKRVVERYRGDMELFRHFDDKQTDKWTDKLKNLQSYSLSQYHNWKQMNYLNRCCASKWEICSAFWLLILMILSPTCSTPSLAPPTNTCNQKIFECRKYFDLQFYFPLHCLPYICLGNFLRQNENNQIQILNIIKTQNCFQGYLDNF